MFTDLCDLGMSLDEIRAKYTERGEQKHFRVSVPARAELCKYDLKYLCKTVLGMKDWDVIHDDIQRFMDGVLVSERNRSKVGRQFKLLLVPRGHLKSSIVTKGWVIQQVLRNHDIRVLIGNSVWLQARKFLGSIQFYLDNKSKLPEYFGQFKPRVRNNNTWNKDSLLINQRELVQDAPTITTCGVESEQVGQHYDIIVLDDVVARENITTKDQRDKVKTFYRDCLSLLEPTGIMIVIGTTWHEDDLYAELEDKNEHPEFEVFKRVAEQGTEESVIFKNKFNLKLLRQIKGTTPESIRSYSAQYLLNPYPSEDMDFKYQWIRYWKELPNEPMYVSVTVDPSLGKDTSDYTGIVAAGRTHDRKTYVLEARHFRRKVDEIPNEVAVTVRRIMDMGFRVSVVGLEPFGFQQTLREPIYQLLKSLNLPDYVELLPYKNSSREGKSERIRSLIPKFANREVFLHDSQQELVREILHWSPDVKGRSDDILDALAWQIYYWDRRPSEVTKRTNVEGTLNWWIKNHMYKPFKDDDFILKEFISADKTRTI